ncbi:hypothetical protein H5411_17990 [Amycolatopsis echigonensis]|uniref:Uncharacterized protein n=1 Tax=Amycolatopsis echigonensis TaxID=2576905 RepID=A0A8E1VZI3_9PSEU|nr:hypothetical protein [Amycolatopsis echigonensis]
MDEEALTALAFGSDAGSSDPIPRDGSPRQRLLAAIVLGARGRYAAAADLLDPLRRGRDPLTASLAASTLASHRRQLGAHVLARKLDGEALLAVGLRGAGEHRTGVAGDGSGLTVGGWAAVGSGSLGVNPGRAGAGAVSAAGGAGSGRAAAGLGRAGAGAGSAAAGAGSDGTAADSGRTGSRTDSPRLKTTASPGGPRSAANPGSLGVPAEDPHGLDLPGARADALLGLAADNLALGRISAARRLAVRAAQADRRWRATVRGGWVGAEIELADGQPEAAVAPARLAYETAVARNARRHIVKSGIVLGVALLAAGQEGARELVVAAAVDAEKYELDSLNWVAARVAADLDHDRAEEYRFRSRQVLHAVLRHADPCVMRIAHESPWVPVGPG